MIAFFDKYTLFKGHYRQQHRVISYGNYQS